MRRPPAILRLVLLAVVVGQGGCGTDPPGRVAIPNPAQRTQAEVVFLVLPGAPDTQSEFLSWVEAGQKEAGEQRAIFRASGPPTGGAPSEQVEAIRTAIAGGATVLVVVPHDPGAVASVLAEAEAKGVAVVTLGSPVVTDPPLPGTAVVPEPFAETARKLVEAVKDDAARRKIPADPPAALLFDRKGDRFSADRAEALKAAARSAGLTHLEPLGYEMAGMGEGRTEAFLVLSRWMKDHPETAIVLAEGDEAMAAASRYRTTTKTDRPILVAGYIGFRGQSNPDSFRGNSAFVEGRVDGLARLAVETGLARRRGEKGAAVVAMPTPFNRAVGDAIRDDGAEVVAEPARGPGGSGSPKPSPGGTSADPARPVGP